MKLYSTDLWHYLKGNIDLRERISIAHKLLYELERIQRAGLVHCDIKPSNVLMNVDANANWNGQLIVTDFGISGKKNELRNQLSKPGGTPGWAGGKIRNNI